VGVIVFPCFIDLLGVFLVTPDQMLAAIGGEQQVGHPMSWCRWEEERMILANLGGPS